MGSKHFELAKKIINTWPKWKQKVRFAATNIDNKIKFGEGQPCDHQGCLNHTSHPCEGCGRVAGNGVIYESDGIGCIDG